MNSSAGSRRGRGRRVSVLSPPRPTCDYPSRRRPADGRPRWGIRPESVASGMTPERRIRRRMLGLDEYLGSHRESTSRSVRPRRHGATQTATPVGRRCATSSQIDFAPPFLERRRARTAGTTHADPFTSAAGRHQEVREGRSARRHSTSEIGEDEILGAFWVPPGAGQKDHACSGPIAGLKSDRGFESSWTEQTCRGVSRGARRRAWSPEFSLYPMVGAKEHGRFTMRTSPGRNLDEGAIARGSNGPPP